jgi:hypothetical protein
VELGLERFVFEKIRYMTYVKCFNENGNCLYVLANNKTQEPL